MKKITNKKLVNQHLAPQEHSFNRRLEETNRRKEGGRAGLEERRC